MKAKRSKRQVPRKWQPTTFPKRRRKWSQNDFVKQTKKSPKQNQHKDWIQSSYSAKTEQSRFSAKKILCVLAKKRWRLPSTKTRLILLITRESSEQDTHYKTENWYWKMTVSNWIRPPDKRSETERFINLENYKIYAPALMYRLRVYAIVT